MTDLGAWKDTSESDDTPRWMLVAVGALLVSLVAVVVVLVVHGPVQLAKATTGPSAAVVVHPEKWDPRIAPYAKIAQKKRGLRFEHPVAVRFLPPGKFEKTVAKDESDLSAEERTELEHWSGMMRAFGLVGGDVDLADAASTAASGGVLAYYSFDDQRITIRGKRLTPPVRSTLVHELTHALQDQHFGIGARMKELAKADGQGSTTSVSTVLDAVIEGDAERVEGLYRDSLTAAQRTALDAGSARQSARADKRLKQVPEVILTMMSAPYVLGEALVQTAYRDGGNEAVDKLLAAPPAHETALLDPFLVLSGDTDATKVEVPKIEKGDKKFDSGEFGSLTWYLMLAERLPLRDALAAVDGWGGDAFVAFERDGTACARMTYVGSDARATKVMGDALRRWVAQAADAPASLIRDGRMLRLESCDPGTSGATGRKASSDALDLVVTRTYLALAAMRSGGSAADSRCLSGRMVDAFSLSQLGDPSFGADDLAIQTQVRGFAASCRS